MAEASKSSSGRVRGERLEARVTRAASLQGPTVTDFVLTSVQDAARRAIEKHQTLNLSFRYGASFR